jgi:hypothetical protein
LPLSVPAQCFQLIARWCRQVTQFQRAIQLPNLSACDLLDSLKAPPALPLMKALSLGTPE